MDTQTPPISGIPARRSIAPALSPRLYGLVLLFVALPAVVAARGWLGISVQDLTPELREAMDLTARSGALVSDIASGSPADRAGLRTRDVIVRIDDSPVEVSKDLIGRLEEKDPGDRVHLTLMRGGGEEEVDATLGSRPEGEPENQRDQEEREKQIIIRRHGPKESAAGWDFFRGGSLLGVEAHGLDENLAGYFHVEPGRGVLILRIEDDSPAAKAGLLPGDVITRINGESVSDVDDLRREARRLNPGDDWKADVVRKGQKIELTGRMERGWRAPAMPGGLRFFGRDDQGQGQGQGEGEGEGEGWSVLDRRQMRRLERQMEELREQIRELEGKIERLRQR